MARAELSLSKEAEAAFGSAQNGKIRFVKFEIEDENFVHRGSEMASNDVKRDASLIVSKGFLEQTKASFILFCLDVNVPALRWILLAFVPENVRVRDKMLYSSSRESFKKQLGMNYFVGEFHATELSEVTYEAFVAAKKKQNVDGPLSDTERMLKEAALLERDTNVKSSAIGVVPFGISQNVREKITLFKIGKFDWIAMRLQADVENVEVVKSIETVDLSDVANVLDLKNPSFVAYRYKGSGTPMTLFLYVCPEDSPVRLKMVYSTCKATILSTATELGLQFQKTIELNDPSSALEDLCYEIAPPKVEEDNIIKPREFSRPVAPGRGRGGMRRTPSASSS